MRLLLIILLAWSLTACSSDGGGYFIWGNSISGHVTASGAPLAGVTVSLAGAATGTTTTDDGGAFRFSDLKNGAYSVSPAKTGQLFTPAALPVAISSTSFSAANFTASPAPPTTAIQLPRTGQTLTYKAGDDGALQKGVAWPDPRFSDTGDGTVTDKLTGLVWLKDASCLGKKTWVDALAAANGMATGACGLSDGSKSGDWRLPNINELNSLISISRWNQAVGPMQLAGSSSDNPFSKTANVNYWSSTTNASLTSQAWSVNLLFGLVTSYFKKGAFIVWPVRDGSSATGAVRLPRTGQTFSYAAGDDGYHQKGAAWPNPRFTDNGAGAVTDNLTRLVWLKNTNCLDTAGGIKRVKPNVFSVLYYYEAIPWVGGLASGACGLSDNSRSGDWRLPNRLEMLSLMDYGRSNPALPAGHPFDKVQLTWVWTSSTLSYNIVGPTANASWVAHPASGSLNTATASTNNQANLWVVRDGAP